ncbi:MAG: NAD(+) synthase [Eubacteriales bacterium]|nr:NAD(+) synthase [Eubacteriales bacterium]
MEDYMKDFDADLVRDEIVLWIRDYFDRFNKGGNAVIAVSGGKDSSVTAALLVEALGKDRVFGVLLPNGVQPDISSSYELVNALGIDYAEINIKGAVDSIQGSMEQAGIPVEDRTKINLPARIRMSTVYAVSQSKNGMVPNTCNLSEDWVGYSTRYGDSAGDFAPIGRLVVQEVRALGRSLGLPTDLVEKVPSDGLSGLTDEDKLGFTYECLDRYIRTGVCDDPEAKSKIDHLHAVNKFKMELMPAFEYDGNIAIL